MIYILLSVTAVAVIFAAHSIKQTATANNLVKDKELVADALRKHLDAVTAELETKTQDIKLLKSQLQSATDKLKAVKPSSLVSESPKQAPDSESDTKHLGFISKKRTYKKKSK